MHNQEAEAEWADRFDRDVERLLQNRDPAGWDSPDLPEDYRETLSVAQTLRSTEVAQLSRVRYSLRQRLTRAGRQRTSAQSKIIDRGVHTMKAGFLRLSTAGRTVTVLALLALFLSLSLTFQPVRALAGQVLGQIGFFNFTNDTAIPEEWIGQENFKQAADTTATPMPVQSYTAPSEQAAEQRAGFDLYVAGYLPECFSLNGRSVLGEQAASTISTSYHCPGKTVYEDVFLHIDQSLLQGSSSMDYAIGDAQPVEITLRGQTGVWIDQAPIGVQTNRNGETELMPVNLLMWEEDGFFFQVRSNRLSQEEMVKVAESLE